MSEWRRILPWGLAALAAVTLLVVIAVMTFAERTPISASIRKQVNFTLLYPKSSAAIKLDQKSIKYDPSVKQLSFIVTLSGRTITFSEQTAPDQFADVAEYYPKFIAQLQGYATFTNAIGKVDLTRPKDVKNQVAVINAKGTLLFARSNGDLTEDDWKRLFNSLIVIPPQN
jgi:hypothetical protein